jgi:hypothetical protein
MVESWWPAPLAVPLWDPGRPRKRGLPPRVTTQRTACLAAEHHDPRAAWQARPSWSAARCQGVVT